MGKPVTSRFMKSEHLEQMEKEFLSIDDISKYLGIKRSTLYLKVEKHEIPFYRFGRLIRFKKNDIDRWTESLRHEAIGSNRDARRFIEATAKRTLDINRIVKKTIEEVKGFGYNRVQREPGQIKDLRKEVEDGTL